MTVSKSASVGALTIEWAKDDADKNVYVESIMLDVDELRETIRVLQEALDDVTGALALPNPQPYPYPYYPVYAPYQITWGESR